MRSLILNPLIKRLDWLPPAIAYLIAVPIAAFIWTLPLQLRFFGVVKLPAFERWPNDDSWF